MSGIFAYSLSVVLMLVFSLVLIAAVLVALYWVIRLAIRHESARRDVLRGPPPDDPS